VVGAQEEPYGVLCAYSASKRTFSENELRFLLAAAKAVGMVIEREATASRIRSLQHQLLSASRTSVMAELGTLLADQLNQPLTALINYVQSCRRMMAFSGAPVPERFDRAMDKAVAEAERAASILRGFRKSIKSGELHTLEEDINRILKDVASLALADAPEKKIKVNYRLDPKLPKAVIDPIQIQQALYDLIRHAVGSLEQSQRRQLILSTQLTDAGMVEVQIEGAETDNHPKRRDEFPEEYLSGLAIGRSIIEAHGGKLWVHDAPDGGVTFRFTVPASSG